jgi:hypothetical protein
VPSPWQPDQFTGGFDVGSRRPHPVVEIPVDAVVASPSPVRVDSPAARRAGPPRVRNPAGSAAGNEILTWFAGRAGPDRGAVAERSKGD